MKLVNIFSFMLIAMLFSCGRSMTPYLKSDLDALKTKPHGKLEINLNYLLDDDVFNKSTKVYKKYRIKHTKSGAHVDFEENVLTLTKYTKPKEFSSIIEHIIPFYEKLWSEYQIDNNNKEINKFYNHVKWPRQFNFIYRVTEKESYNGKDNMIGWADGTTFECTRRGEKVMTSEDRKHLLENDRGNIFWKPERNNFNINLKPGDYYLDFVIYIFDATPLPDLFGGYLNLMILNYSHIPIKINNNKTVTFNYASPKSQYME